MTAASDSAELASQLRDDALSPPRASPHAPWPGRIRVRSEDFQVDEDLGFAPSGDGEHALLRIEKCDLNTADAARTLARALGVAPRDVGYAGLKDRHALTCQWFSVPARAVPEELPAFERMRDPRHDPRSARRSAVRRTRRKASHRIIPLNGPTTRPVALVA